MSTAIELDYFGGYAPIQAGGKVDGLNFYFRARWDTRTFEIGKLGVDVPTLQEDALLFTREGDYSPNDSHEETAAVIVNCFQEYFVKMQNPNAEWLLLDITSKLNAAMKREEY